MKLSFNSSALTRGVFEGNPVSFHATLHKLEDERYQGIELGTAAPHPTLESHPNKQKREQVRKEVADHGLAFSGMSPNLRDYQLVSVEDCGPYIAGFARYVLFADDLGISTIRVDTAEPLAGLSGIDPKRMFDRVVKAFGLCSKIAADRGIRVSWEFEPHLPLHTPEEIAAVVDAVRAQGHANFGAMFDTSHAYICADGNVAELLQRLQGKINHVHLADCDGTRDENGISRHLPLGAGKIDFAKLLPAFAQASDWWTVDLYNCAEAWDAVALAKRYLERFKI